MSDLARPHDMTDPAALAAPDPAQPRISVVMANFNGGQYLRRAVRSVLDQTHRNLELILSDDGSRDDSRDIIRQEMARDRRIRLVEAPASTGPAGARNRALAVASGDWIAIVDSDDIIHPERLARLLLSAQALDADLVADDLIYFGDEPGDHAGTLLQPLALQGPHQIDAKELVSGVLCGRKDVSLGYLKPLIRRSALGQVRYDESLRIDEDHNLYLRLTLAGAKFMLIPDAMYLYRRHRLSTSHRQSAANLERMLAAQSAFLRDLPSEHGDLRPTLLSRMREHSQELGYMRALEALKARDWLSAARRLLQNPRNLVSLLHSAKEHALRQRHQQPTARTRMTLALGHAASDALTAFPGHSVFEVPDLPDTPWSPSQASIWARLARLACDHDLDIVAVGPPGQYALGLVPRHVAAQVLPVPEVTSDVAPALRDTRRAAVPASGTTASFASPPSAWPEEA